MSIFHHAHFKLWSGPNIQTNYQKCSNYSEEKELFKLKVRGFYVFTGVLGVEEDPLWKYISLVVLMGGGGRGVYKYIHTYNKHTKYVHIYICFYGLQNLRTYIFWISVIRRKGEKPFSKSILFMYFLRTLWILWVFKEIGFTIGRI